jgi:hypothetical protein
MKSRQLIESVVRGRDAKALVDRLTERSQSTKLDISLVTDNPDLGLEDGRDLRRNVDEWFVMAVSEGEWIVGDDEIQITNVSVPKIAVKGSTIKASLQVETFQPVTNPSAFRRAFVGSLLADEEIVINLDSGTEFTVTDVK